MRFLRAAILLVVASAPAHAGDASYLFTLSGPGRIATAQGSQYHIAIDRQAVMRSMSGGGLWVVDPLGGREYVKFARSVVHDDGSWTFVGHVAGGDASNLAVVTFGKGNVFGQITLPRGELLTINTTRAGETELVVGQQHAGPMATAALRDMAAIAFDASAADAAPRQLARTAASSSEPMTLDLLVIYNTGYKEQMGSASAVNTYIYYLFDFLNQVFIESKVNARVRLVHTAEVAYSSQQDLKAMLMDLTSAAQKGSPSSLANVAAMRDQYGADLVLMLANPAVANILGYETWTHDAPLTASDAASGYTVVIDQGTVGGTQFAEALGANLGLADMIKGTPGSYAFGLPYIWVDPYGNQMNTLLGNWGGHAPYFSNPSISSCDGPCGVTDQRDQVRALNLNIPVVAGFRAARAVVHPLAVGDVDGNGTSDFLLRNDADGSFQVVPLKPVFGGAPPWCDVLSGSAPSAVDRSYQLVARGDFTGDGALTDLVWANAASVWLWVSDGSGFSFYQRISDAPSGWNIVGAGDVDGDGKSDLFWRNSETGNFAYWLMDGATVRWRSPSVAVSLAYQIAAIGDFTGDGRIDIVWTNGVSDWLWASTGKAFAYSRIGNHPQGWTIVGAADLDIDGKTDLLWRNNSTGGVAYWLMNGPEVLVKAPSVAQSTRARLLAIGQFTGDSYPDLLWGNEDENDPWFWPGYLEVWSGMGKLGLGSENAKPPYYEDSAGNLKAYLLPTGWTLENPPGL